VEKLISVCREKLDYVQRGIYNRVFFLSVLTVDLVVPFFDGFPDSTHENKLKILIKIIGKIGLIY